MSVLQKVRITSNERLDLPDFLNVENLESADWLSFIKRMLCGPDSDLTGQNYIIEGFDIINAPAIVNSVVQFDVEVNLADGVVFFPEDDQGVASKGAFFVAASSAINPKVSLSSTDSNFIQMNLVTSTGSSDLRTFWDASANNGAGGEFDSSVDTITNLDVNIYSNTTGFDVGSVPIAIVITSAGVITSIQDSRPLFFRLGTGGLSPDPHNKFTYPDEPTGFSRKETPFILTTNGGDNPFFGADKNIKTLKQWMDAVLSRIAELAGTNFWYSDGVGSVASLNIHHVWQDLNAIIIPDASWIWVSPEITVPTLKIVYPHTPVEFSVTGSGQTLTNDKDSLVVALIRDEVQPGNWTFTNGSTTVITPNGHANVLVGDYIKLDIDGVEKYETVASFPNSTSALLTNTYTGLTGVGRAHRTDNNITFSVIAPTATSTADTFWLAKRDGTDLYVR